MPRTPEVTPKGEPMADKKYLQKRGNCWYIRVPKPPRLWGKDSEFVCTLGTPDLKVARQLRDDPFPEN